MNEYFILDVTYLGMNADGFEQFVGGVSRQEGHKHMLGKQKFTITFLFISNEIETDSLHSPLTCSLVVSITRAFGTNNAVLVFLINITDITGIEIWRKI